MNSLAPSTDPEVTLCLRLRLNHSATSYLKSSSRGSGLAILREILDKISLPQCSERHILLDRPNEGVELYWNTTTDSPFSKELTRRFGKLTSGALGRNSVQQASLYHLAPFATEIPAFATPVGVCDGQPPPQPALLPDDLDIKPNLDSSPPPTGATQTLKTKIARAEARLRAFQDTNKMTGETTAQERVQLHLSASLQQRDSDGRTALRKLLQQVGEHTFEQNGDWTFVEGLVPLERHNLTIGRELQRIRTGYHWTRAELHRTQVERNAMRAILQVEREDRARVLSGMQSDFDRQQYELHHLKALRSEHERTVSLLRNELHWRREERARLLRFGFR